MDKHLEGGRNQMQVQDGGGGGDADAGADDDEAAVAEEGQVQEGARADIQARLRRAPGVIVAKTWANGAQRTRQPRELFQAGSKEVKKSGRGKKDR